MSDSSTVQGGTSLAPAFHWAGENFGTFDSVVFWNSYSICITKVFFFFVACTVKDRPEEKQMIWENRLFSRYCPMHKQHASGTDFVLAASCFKWALFHHWTTVAMGGATFLLALAHSVQQCFLSPDSRFSVKVRKTVFCFFRVNILSCSVAGKKIFTLLW